MRAPQHGLSQSELPAPPACTRSWQGGGPVGSSTGLVAVTSVLLSLGFAVLSLSGVGNDFIVLMEWNDGDESQWCVIVMRHSGVR